ncbi:amphi-Trp domain-containing protein [Halomonas almeriensis]|uniref:amphi-Trp domain-containing protein n=1 Tax=Halomonas almeriensis TaxID=308163 RepID=UPI0025B4BC4E|nr:amphi-Trp domain-containing protein [Halomonas almeriensis]MDN3553260.1 amphi-Trp domain-containing protein [Halomonas almeriensis]
MKTEKNLFRHESLQSIKGAQDILKAITKGLAKGVLSFSDDHGEIRLAPRGLLHLKVTARKEDDYHRLDIRLSWQANNGASKKSNLQISHDE